MLVFSLETVLLIHSLARLDGAGDGPQVGVSIGITCDGIDRI